MDLQYKDLAPVLEMAISPVILISACGMLLLSMTNRLGRVIDRTRFLGREKGGIREAQILILRRRVKLIRACIFLITLCMLSTSVLILTIFSSALFALEASHLVVILFGFALVCLILSLIYFLLDISHSLDAMEADIQGS